MTRKAKEPKVLSECDPNDRPFVINDTWARFFEGRERETILSGPGGTGKTRCVMEYIHQCCEKYPGMRALVVRKTRASLTESALWVFEKEVLGPGHYLLDGPARTQRHSYIYRNKSEIVCGGLDVSSRLFSTAYDLVYVNEAGEITEDDWENLFRAQRSGVMPYQRMLGDTNPYWPKHWIKQREKAGKLVLMETTHRDNARMYENGKLTPYGRMYMGKLEALSGPRRDRLLLGLWKLSSGVVFDVWNHDIHVIDRFPIPAEWPRYLSIDWGYVNPCAALWWAIDGDGRMYRYREIYRTGLLVEDLARMVLELSRGDPPLRAIVCDHDAGDRATFEKHSGMSTMPAYKDVENGIQAMMARLRPAGDGKPRLFYVRGSLVGGEDQVLLDAKKPTCTEDEIPGYHRPPATERVIVSARAEHPVKKDDHGIDSSKYMVAFLDIGAGGELAQAPVDFKAEQEHHETEDPWKHTWTVDGGGEQEEDPFKRCW